MFEAGDSTTMAEAMIPSFWPEPAAFLEISPLDQVTDGKARCTGLAICDADGRASSIFSQGELAHFFYEFEVLDPLPVPSGGLEFRNADGLVIHGKSSFQQDAGLPLSVEAGQRVRVHHVIHLDVAEGNYDIALGFASVHAESYRSYASGAIGKEPFAPDVHCRTGNVASFTVRLQGHGKRVHHGVANLDGASRLTLVRASGRTASPAKQADDVVPALVHVTHWKAGSQWIFRILKQCAPDRIVEPTPSQSQFLHSPIRRGRIYPTVYVPKPAFDRARCPPGTRHFVVIRDLRDTLVSAYFSFKISHPRLTEEFAVLRSTLQQLSQEDGLLYLLQQWLHLCADIQLTWKEAGEAMIRYEDLLGHDVEILEKVLLADMALPLDRERLGQAIRANRFEAFTGRALGTQELTAHERVGAPGDWRNHFTDRLKDAFKIRYGGLLVATGYEPDLDW